MAHTLMGIALGCIILLEIAALIVVALGLWVSWQAAGDDAWAQVRRERREYYRILNGR